MSQDKTTRNLNINRFRAISFGSATNNGRNFSSFTQTANIEPELNQILDLIMDQTLLNSMSVSKTPLLKKLGTNQFPIPKRKPNKLETSTLTTTDSEDNSMQEESLEELRFKMDKSKPRRTNSDPISDSSLSPKSPKIPKPLTLSIEGCKCGQILCVLNHFIMSMRPIWNSETAYKFSKEIQKLLDFVSLNNEAFKTARADSIAVCFILLVGSKLQISKKDFVSCLRLQKLTMVENIGKVKKTKCYADAKKAFIRIQKGI